MINNLICTMQLHHSHQCHLKLLSVKTNNHKQTMALSVRLLPEAG